MKANPNTTKTLAGALGLIVLILGAGTEAAAEEPGDGNIGDANNFQVKWKYVEHVGSTENLIAITLTASNKTGDANIHPSTFSGTLSGQLHQEQYGSGKALATSETDEVWRGWDPAPPDDDPSPVDSYFLLHGYATKVGGGPPAEDPYDDPCATTSTEPVYYSAFLPDEVTAFVQEMGGEFSLSNYPNQDWTFARLAVPYGSYVTMDAVIAGGGVEGYLNDTFPATPEPRTLALLAMGGLAVLRRTRRLRRLA
jgi:hypothetical protein